MLTDAGIYHSAKRVGVDFQVGAEDEPPRWQALFGTNPVLHIQPGAKLYLYNAIFAPRGLHATILHLWQWQDEKGNWTTQQRVPVTINGGREDGYRFYSFKSAPRPGQWRVNIDAFDGRAIGRVRFSVEEQAVPPAITLKTLKAGP